MARVPVAPRPSGGSYDRDRRQVRAEIERLDRKKHAPAPARPFVHVEPEASENWGPGEAWLDTSGE